MAQSDQTVQNATFPTVRADINDNLAALFSQSSGIAAPSTTVAFQPWIDTSSTPAVWKIRNASNSGWITIGVLDATFAVGGVTPIANGGTGQTTASGAINALLPSQATNSGRFLTTNGTVTSWAAIGLTPTIQIFTSSTTWTCPAGVSTAIVGVIGGGGGGGGSGDGLLNGGNGGVGGAGLGVIAVTAGLSYTVTIGSGGAGSNTGNANAGGTSSFAQGATTLISCTGGGAGLYEAGSGASGTCTSTSANLRRGHIGGVDIPYLSSPVTFRANGAGLAASAWAITTNASPGSRGTGDFNDGNNASGGHGGAVVIQYWG